MVRRWFCGGQRPTQIEAVRVHESYRGRGLGAAMLGWAIEEARRRGCGLVQLTTDNARPDARRFYERLGFVASHQGMKLSLASAGRCQDPACHGR
jgi:GNAT superfamily N-acetyltransferase